MPVPCPHGKQVRPGVVACAKGLYGGQPHEATCRKCPPVLPWGDSLQPANAPSAFDSRLRTCDECPGRPSCAVWTSGDCRGRTYLCRPLACCPLGPPRWGP